MKANIARTKYFEDYVSFEFYVRRIAIGLGIKSAGSKLGVIIEKISNTPEFPSFEIKVKTLLIHKRRRNWLAHQHQNSTANPILVSDFNEIKDFNNILIEVSKRIRK